MKKRPRARAFLLSSMSNRHVRLCLLLILLLILLILNIIIVLVAAQESTQNNEDHLLHADHRSSSTSSSSSSIHNRQVIVTVNLPDYGRIQGYRHAGVDFFGGVPYAAPPVGMRRWAPPEPPTPWAPAILDARQFGPDCWQLVDALANPSATTNHMSEDCLYLNVFTPAGQASSSSSSSSATLTSSATSTLTAHTRFFSSYPHPHQNKPPPSSSRLLPVMVWLHGGAFQQGGARRSEYDGRRLAARGTIIVTLNYRLGALGFLVSSPDGVLGNFGVMDQRAALQWIKDNIQSLGGDPDNVTLFGESAGAVMTGLHLMMDGAGTLFHKAMMQSNPLGLQFRSVVIGDFIGEAFKASVDCRDLACLRAERVEELMRAQSSLMGVPRSVGDFFTWGPTLTHELRLILGRTGSTGSGSGSSSSTTQPHTASGAASLSSSISSSSPLKNYHNNPKKNAQHALLFRDLNAWTWQYSNRDTSWSAAVNVSQPLNDLALIPHNIPIVLGVNKHEGEMFVHGAFPIPIISKAVYWMFVGALFRDSARRVLKHYRGHVDQIENDAAILAQKQMEEEENRQFYVDHQEELDDEYQRLLHLNASRRTIPPTRKSAGGVVEALWETWSNSRGGGDGSDSIHHMDDYNDDPKKKNNFTHHSLSWHEKHIPFFRPNLSDPVVWEKIRQREEKRKNRIKKLALKEAAKVVVDYRPVMSRIIDDYLFRCPTWHFAQQLSRNRLSQGQTNNVYVYRFSHSTHIPGYKECWGKSCHTSELPYVFQAMDIIRSNYSTLGPYAQRDAPAAPVFPFTDLLAAYQAAREAAFRFEHEPVNSTTTSSTTTAEEEAMAMMGGGGGGGGGYGARSSNSNNNNNNNNNSSSSSSSSSINMGFQRLLDTFFGDYFKEDADEEIASDMAERWVAFARNGDPNYDGNRASWRPWRYVFADDHHDAHNPDHSNTQHTWEPEDFDQILYSEEDEDEDEDERNRTNNHKNTNFSHSSSSSNSNSKSATAAAMEGFLWSEDPLELELRRRALRALGMEVIEEDLFQTMLMRTPKASEDNDNPFRFLFGGGGSSSNSGNHNKAGSNTKKATRDDEVRMTRRAIRQLQQIVQDLGLLGKGLHVDGSRPRGGGGGGGGSSSSSSSSSSSDPNHWTEDFFPEILELKWPPEGRLIERDCTCDMWDRIRYRY